MAEVPNDNQPSIFRQEAGAPETPASLSMDQYIDTIMYALTGPLVGFRGWEDLLKNHKNQITMYRLAHALDIFREEQATEYEAMLYIMTATLAQPINADWVAIYGHLFCQFYPEKGKDIWEDDFDHKLDQNCHEMLTNLRRWLFKTQMNHLEPRKAVEPAAKHKAQKKAPKIEAERPKMF